eukprot:1913237-Pleurochrysis_carterae.AAC.2
MRRYEPRIAQSTPRCCFAGCAQGDFRALRRASWRLWPLCGAARRLSPTRDAMPTHPRSQIVGDRAFLAVSSTTR